MSIGETADERGCDGLEEGEEGAQCAAEEDDIIARVDWFGEGVLVRVEIVKDAV